MPRRRSRPANKPVEEVTMNPTFVRNMSVACAAFAALSCSAFAQNIDDPASMGRYYANLYLQTHWMAAMYSHTGRRVARRTAPRRHTHAAPTWTLNPARSIVIQRMVASAPAERRAVYRSALPKIMALYPEFVRLGSKAEGVALRANDVRDTATIAGVAAYEELTGKDLSQAQFLAERKGTYHSFATNDTTPEQMQHDGETYALAVCMMGGLKAYEKNPQNKNPALTRQQLHDVALETFRTGYQDADYTKFAATERGIVKVRK